jgi:hypothetical protein
MQYKTDIWATLSSTAETSTQQMSNAVYGFSFHGLCILGFALILCRLSSRGRSTKIALNWFWLICSFAIGPKIPVLIPESATLKVLLFVAGALLILLAPLQLSVYLSKSERQRRYIQITLVALLVVVFVVDLLIRRCV